MSLPLLRACSQVLEVRADQLRCTTEETKAFFKVVMGLQLPDETVEEVAARTEGWLVGLQLLGLSLPGHVDPASLLREVSGDQRYILDYLTEVVLRQQLQDVQTFLLSTCILERLNALLCDAVMQQSGSQQMLQRLELANLFVVSLDSRRRWYRYHALFAEALHYRLERTQADQVPNLHHRASLWYAQHDFPTEAILHAFSAKEWHWAADLIEHLPVVTLTWGAGEHELVRLRHWLEQLPADIVYTCPRLCLACAHMLWTVVPSLTLQAWLDAAEATLTASLTTRTQQDASSSMLSSQARQEQENLLGEVIAFRAYLLSFKGGGQAALRLCQQALSLLSADNGVARAVVCWTLLRTYYASSANDAESAIQRGLQGGLLAQRAGKTALAITLLGSTACLMIGTGRLHEIERLDQQATQWGTQPGQLVLPEVGWPTLFQAEALREWNKLDAALSLAEEAISLCKETKSMASLTYMLCGYAMLLRILLSRGELDASHSALQQVERIGMRMNQSWVSYLSSLFTMVDQIRLWLACGELERATRWAEELDLGKWYGTPFAREREEVARARILLATGQPTLALQRLEPVLKRATAGKRWGHVIEIRLLQALAYQMYQQEMLALATLSETIRLAEPEGYIRSFIDEGAPMEALLYRLRKRDRDDGPTPYLDMLLAAFQQESMARVPVREATKAQLLPEPLSERELQVLQLLVCGASNQEIAQDLVIVVDTVKRHVSYIFSKLGVKNRVQAVGQAKVLGLLDEEL